MKGPFVFKSKERWPSCKHPKKQLLQREDHFKTMNSLFSDVALTNQFAPDTSPSLLTASSMETMSQSTDEEGNSKRMGSFESAVRGAVRSENRLFFEPVSVNRSILEKTKPGGFHFKESFVLTMDSDNPYVDFQRSMEEMLRSHRVKGWKCLQELLNWYLKANSKSNHVYIFSAFFDVVVGIAKRSKSSYHDFDDLFLST